MKSIKIWNDNPSEKQIGEIAAALGDGQVVLLPTDTLYGVACDALNSKAIERICRLKDINPDKAPLSVICSDISMASEYARIDNAAFKMLKENTPGPFTFLMRALPVLPKAFKGRKVVGIRIPDCATARLVAERLGHPIMTTSIEFDDPDYAINPELVAEAYEGRADLIVSGEDGGTEPSTVVDCTESSPEIVRQGLGMLQ